MAVGEEKVTMRVRFGTTYDRLRFWNGPIGLTDKELEVLGALLDCEGELCGTDNRKLTCAALGMSKEVLNTYIKRLRGKKALTLQKGTYTLHQIFHDRSRVEVLILGK
jgi:hypothetical protein